jgi:hypothetical protein
MEWFSQKTSIAGIQMPNWGIVLGADGRFVRIMAGLNIPSDLARWLAAAAPLEGGTPAHGPSRVIGMSLSRV